MADERFAKMFYVTVKGHMFIQNYLKACGFTIIISNIHVIQRRAITKFRRDEYNVSFYVLCNISSMRRSVSSPNETLRREMKIRRAVDYEQSPIFPQGQQSERNASTRENHPTREKATRGGEREKSFFSLPVACRLFSRGVIFTRARVSLALLSLRKNGGLLVVQTCSVLMNFEVFLLEIKKCVKCLILVLKQNNFTRRN